MALVPGAIDSGGGTQKSIRLAGRGGDDNNFRFDGVDATGISNQAPNAGYRLQISSEAINEFKVDTVLFNADILHRNCLGLSPDVPESCEGTNARDS